MSNEVTVTLDVNKATRAGAKGQKPVVLWFTGLSGAGKSTIANLVEKKLLSLNHHTYLLDGDNVRHGLNKDLGFTDTDRIENIRRVGEVAKLMTDAGLIVLTAFISPFRAERDMVRGIMPGGEFLEIFIDSTFKTRPQLATYPSSKNRPKFLHLFLLKPSHARSLSHLSKIRSWICLINSSRF